ncbi:MAG TPA: hypothetical protein VG387_02755 [Rhizomicrobium sp.]|jgi:hypothetical protein|nr:hypothetical protein [Rhizomicrobium sp.]
MRISDATLAFLLLGAASAHAESITDAVPSHPGVTYEALLRQAMPDLAKGADGHWSSKSLPHLRGTDGKLETGAELDFDDVSPILLKENGRVRLLVMTGDSQTDSGFSAILAAFDADQRVPKLLDDMDVGGDRFVMFGSPRTLPIGAGSEALIVNTNHFNSNQNYSQDTLLYLRGGKLRVALSQFTFNSGFCGYEERQVPVYAARDDKDAAYRAIVVTVTQTVTHTDESCDEGTKIPKASKHTYTNVYRWDAKKTDYVLPHDAMKPLIAPDQQ